MITFYIETVYGTITLVSISSNPVIMIRIILHHLLDTNMTQYTLVKDGDILPDAVSIREVIQNGDTIQYVLTGAEQI